MAKKLDNINKHKTFIIQYAMWNARSIRNKESEIIEKFENLNLNVLVIRETKKKRKSEKLKNKERIKKGYDDLIHDDLQWDFK